MESQKAEYSTGTYPKGKIATNFDGAIHVKAQHVKLKWQHRDMEIHMVTGAAFL